MLMSLDGRMMDPRHRRFIAVIGQNAADFVKFDHAIDAIDHRRMRHPFWRCLASFPSE